MLMKGRGDCMTTREKQKLETKQKILSAITKLANVYGIENLKVRAICKEAEISIGTFYNYYDSIESILIDAIAHHQEITIQTLNALLMDENEIKNIESFLKHQVSTFRNVPYSLKKEVFRIFISHPEIKILEVNRTNYDLIYSMIERGQKKNQVSMDMQAEAMTRVVLKLLIGNCFVNCMRVENYDFSDQLVSEVMQIVRNK